MVRALIHILIDILNGAVAGTGLYVDVRVKTGREVRIIRCHITVAVRIALPRLRKSATVIRTFIPRLTVITNDSLLLKVLGEPKPTPAITYARSGGIIITARAV